MELSDVHNSDWYNGSEGKNSQKSEQAPLEEVKVTKPPEKRARWVSAQTAELECPWTRLHNEIVEFYHLYGPNSKRDEIGHSVYLRMKDCITNKFGKTMYRVLKYGSR